MEVYLSHYATDAAIARFTPQDTLVSGSTNLPEGTVHVFRDISNADAEGVVCNESGNGLALAVLAVPSWMTPSDFLAFVAPAAEGIAHLRIIR